MSQITGERPRQFGGAGLGEDEAPTARAEYAEHHQGEAQRREHGSHDVQSRVLIGGCVAHPPGQGKNDQNDKHLTDEYPAP